MLRYISIVWRLSVSPTSLVGRLSGEPDWSALVWLRCYQRRAAALEVSAPKFRPFVRAPQQRGTRCAARPL